MPNRTITVQFRAGALEGECYTGSWEEEWTWLEVISDAALALGSLAVSSATVTTRNVTTDAEERTLDTTDDLSTETAAAMTIAVEDYDTLQQGQIPH